MQFFFSKDIYQKNFTCLFLLPLFLNSARRVEILSVWNMIQKIPYALLFIVSMPLLLLVAHDVYSLPYRSG